MRKIYKIKNNELINDSCFSYLGKSRIDGGSIYYVDFYTITNVKMKEIKKHFDISKHKEKYKDVKQIVDMEQHNEHTTLTQKYEIPLPNVIKDVKQYLNEKHHIKLQENELEEVSSIIDHLPFLHE